MDSTLWSEVEAERLSLADLLSTLSPDQWETQSLCAQWRVRDVAAHLSMTPTEPSLGAIARGLVKARGRIWDFGRDVAREHAKRPVEVIVAELRRDAASRHLPALTNGDNCLLDVLVHAQDITRPLGIDHPLRPLGGASAFRHAWSMGWPFFARRRLRGLRLIADDADIDVGGGEVVEGHLVDLLLLTTGRTSSAVPRLTGPGVRVLAHLLPPGSTAQPMS
ncbi:uncharacterized protein (TIGR03083 family) [Brevibacterium sanguinis]|uniref:Uncharacterized protein (TIGR03083 family) n=2 Tax=Brevibacterium TaxID=1696 RepID=A0A366IIT8_9MICO|nr:MULTISPECIES: maleylpyruvate isomerase family mycothiol-dependent enzyme [Brevibacterium]RBP62007.1 uncharacterized protein (TIGR03083 family) [Brevibacterium sanguinis]RBP70571.1 uncharacterized protein (TIGR03083 family) [Brevibacterium celere]